MADWQYYLLSLLLVLLSGGAWLTNLLGLPGNWLVLGATGLFAYFLPVEAGQGVGWRGLVILTLLALAGEVVEFVAGAAGAAKQGASRRAVLLACVGTFVGGIVGVIVGLPIPILGSLVAALLGSAAGAFVGAYLGQKWSRRGEGESLAAGRGAFVGRLWGAAGKLLAGVAMLVVLVVDLFFA